MQGKTMQPLMWPVSGGVEPVYVSNECLHVQTLTDQDRTELTQDGEVMCGFCGEYTGQWLKVWVER